MLSGHASQEKKKRVSNPLQAEIRERKLCRSIVIESPVEDVFSFWRDFGNLPLFMKDVERVEVISPTRSRWEIKLHSGLKTAMQKGDILGHETMGEVVAVGAKVSKVKVGDKIVIPFDIGCGSCHHCKEKQYSACDNSNPNAVLADKLYGYSGSGIFGYSHMYGGYAGGREAYKKFNDQKSECIKVIIDMH